MIKKQFIDGMKIDELIADYLDIQTEQITGLNFDANGIEVEYDEEE